MRYAGHTTMIDRPASSLTMIPNCLQTPLGLGTLAVLSVLVFAACVGPMAATGWFGLILAGVLCYGLASGPLYVLTILGGALYLQARLRGVLPLPAARAIQHIRDQVGARCLHLSRAISVLVVQLLSVFDALGTLPKLTAQWSVTVQSILRAPLYVAYCVTAARAPTG